MNFHRPLGVGLQTWSAAATCCQEQVGSRYVQHSRAELAVRSYGRVAAKSFLLGEVVRVAIMRDDAADGGGRRITVPYGYGDGE